MNCSFVFFALIKSLLMTDHNKHDFYLLMFCFHPIRLVGLSNFITSMEFYSFKNSFKIVFVENLKINCFCFKTLITVNVKNRNMCDMVICKSDLKGYHFHLIRIIYAIIYKVIYFTLFRTIKSVCYVEDVYQLQLMCIYCIAFHACHIKVH